MVSLLREAIAKEPAHDHAGPHRVLALLLLRAPGWPVGPGDPDLALKEARAAAQLDGAYPPNHLAVAEALYKTDDKLGALGVYGHARDLAERARAEGNPDAVEWSKQAQDGADLSAH
jgi:hypothetical protein